MGPPAAPRVVAGGVGLISHTRWSRQQDAHAAGEQGRVRHRRREVPPPPTVRQDQQRHDHPDEASLVRARRLAGLKGYVTNIDATVMPAREVIGSYHDLWQVEASFRMSKTDLRARPIFHHTREAIEAHLTVVFAAPTLARIMQDATGVILEKIITTLRPVRAALIQANGKTQKFPVHLPEGATELVHQSTGQTGH